VQNTGVLLVNADGALDGFQTTCTCAEVSIKVGDATQAVATESKRVGKSTNSVLSGVESVLAVVREGGLAIRNDHLGDRKTVKERASSVLAVIVGYVGEDETLTVAESNVELPILPAHSATLELVANALGLDHVKRLEALAKLEVRLILDDLLRQVVVVGGRRSKASASRGLLVCLSRRGGLRVGS
jgi:hypothetical protein